MKPVVIDQSLIKDYPDFPRPLEWWRGFIPGWLDVTVDDRGRVTLEPNGKHVSGPPSPVTPALRRRGLKAARQMLGFGPFGKAVLDEDHES